MSIIVKPIHNSISYLKHWSAITLTPNTKKVYEYCIAALIKEGLDINNFDPLYLDAFFKNNEQRTSSKGSLKNKISALSSFYNYLVKKGELKINPIKYMAYKIVIKPNSIKIKKRAIGLEIIDKMFKNMEDETRREGLVSIITILTPS